FWLGPRPMQPSTEAPSMSSISFGTIYKQYGLAEVGRELKRQLDSGRNPNTLACELLEWMLGVAREATTEPDRYLVEIPDTLAIARWRRDANVVEIARCIVGTLKYEPHAADTTALREALLNLGRCTSEEPGQ